MVSSSDFLNGSPKRFPKRFPKAVLCEHAVLLLILTFVKLAINTVDSKSVELFSFSLLILTPYTVNVEIFALYIFSLNSHFLNIREKYIHCGNYYHYSLKSHLY